MTRADEIKRRQKLAAILMEHIELLNDAGEIETECCECLGEGVLEMTAIIKAMAPTVDRLAEKILAAIDAGKLDMRKAA